MATLSSIVKELTTGLHARQKDILTKRFCLDQMTKEGLTLAELGKAYGITRERIRQIETSALLDVRKKIPRTAFAKSILAVVHKYIDHEEGVARESALLAEIKNNLGFLMQPAQLGFFLEAEGRLALYPEDKDFYTFWYNDNDSRERAAEVIKKTHRLFSERKRELLRDGKMAYTKLSESEKAHLALSKKFGANIYGDYGLTEWPEINPKTIRDRSYLVLKKADKPAHFRDIAKFVGERKFDMRPVFASTVHNELIKDRRFVLVGRGVYGLTEQGYHSGTTREVIADILKSNGPLTTSAVIKLVSGERQFKESTILLNLQNKRHFRRLDDGTYSINEA